MKPGDRVTRIFHSYLRDEIGERGTIIGTHHHTNGYLIGYDVAWNASGDRAAREEFAFGACVEQIPEEVEAAA